MLNCYIVEGCNVICYTGADGDSPLFKNRKMASKVVKLMVIYKVHEKNKFNFFLDEKVTKNQDQITLQPALVNQSNDL